jgi:hypothetical protein
MDENKFQRLAGLAVYCEQYHSGQWSRLYRIMSRIRFTASDNALMAIQKRIGPARDEWLDANDWYRRYRDAGKRRAHA